MSVRILVLRLAAFVFSPSVMVTPVLAANSQGMMCGISVGDRHDYLYIRQLCYDDEAITDQRYSAYLAVEGVPELPLTVGNLAQDWSYMNYSCYYEDGTA